MADKKVTPVLKWPGGKRRVLPELKKYIPKTYTSYYEPFIGGGAMFFDLSPMIATVSDVNEELINIYKEIQQDPTNLLTELGKHALNHSESYFYQIRALDRDDILYAALSSAEKAARMIYLNRTCFNGLYRVNSKNQFNAPYGKYTNPRIVDAENIQALHDWMSLRKITFSNGDYSSSLKSATAGSFIYLDPPYVPATETASFVSYSKDGFSMENQEALKDLALTLDAAGSFIMLSNSDTPLTRELYKDFIIKPINVSRSVGASASSRNKVGEVIVLGKTLAAAL